MTKKEEYNSHHLFRPYRVRVSMIKCFRMMCLEWLGKAMIKIDGFMLPKSSNKKPKAISIRVKVRHIFSMILAKHIKVSKTLRYLFGTKQKDKY